MFDIGIEIIQGVASSMGVSLTAVNSYLQKKLLTNEKE